MLDGFGFVLIIILHGCVNLLATNLTRYWLKRGIGSNYWPGIIKPIIPTANAISRINISTCQLIIIKPHILFLTPYRLYTAHTILSKYYCLFLTPYVIIKSIEPEARRAIMSKEISQEELAEAYEHDADHPVAEKEDYEIPEDVLLMMHVQNLIRKSKLAHEEYLKKQAEIWGVPDENIK